MINLKYKDFVILFEIMERYIKELTTETRGKKMKNTDIDFWLILLVTMKIGSR